MSGERIAEQYTEYRAVISQTAAPNFEGAVISTSPSTDRDSADPARLAQSYPGSAVKRQHRLHVIGEWVDDESDQPGGEVSPR